MPSESSKKGSGRKEEGKERWAGQCESHPCFTVYFYLDFVPIPNVTPVQFNKYCLLCGKPCHGPGDTAMDETHTDNCLEEVPPSRVGEHPRRHYTPFISQVMKSIFREGEGLVQGHTAYTVGEQDQSSGL